MIKKEPVKKGKKVVKPEPIKKLEKVTKKAQKPKRASTKLAPAVVVPEYYDLPYRYNQTVVKILAQTPKILFVYWDVSDADRKNFIDKYGADFFNETCPVLIVYNETHNYSFEVQIDDFANSWYLHVNDAKSKYRIELGRKPKFNSHSIPNTYIYITTSNVIEAPNDRILIDKLPSEVAFINVKTKQITKKKLVNKDKTIYKIYRELQQEQDVHRDMPTSGGITSGGTYG